MEINYIKFLLSEKKEFENWRELCEYLGEHYNGQTNSRKALEKKFRQFFEFEKVEGSNRIKITEVFDVMRPNFKSKGSNLPEYLDPAILSVLKEGEFITNSQIASKINLTSNEIINFYKNEECVKNIVKWLKNNETICRDEEELKKETESFRFKYINYYVSVVQSSYKASFDSALDRLQRKGLIDFEKVLVIRFPKSFLYDIKEIIHKDGIIGLKGKVFPWIYDSIIRYKDLYEFDSFLFEEELKSILQIHGMSDKVLRKANEDEVELHDSIKNKLLKELGYESEKAFLASTCHDRKARNAYYSELTERLSNYNVSFYMAYYIERIFDNVKVDKEAITRLNEVFYNARIRSFENKADKDLEERLQQESYPNLKKVVLARGRDKKKVYFKQFADRFIKLQ